MGVRVDVVYQGDLRCKATHEPSADDIYTDAPVDNLGKGEAFSPTDLVGTAMATCMLTIMGIAAQKHDIDIRGASATVVKDMIADPRRRIKSLPVVITLAVPVSDKEKKILDAAARSCPVFESLDDRVEKSVRFVWADESVPKVE